MSHPVYYVEEPIISRQHYMDNLKRPVPGLLPLPDNTVGDP